MKQPISKEFFGQTFNTSVKKRCMTIPMSLPPNTSGTFQQAGTCRFLHHLGLWRAQASQDVHEI